MKVFEKINDYINKNGLNKSAISRKAGISESELKNMLSGKKTIDSSDLRAICLAMNVRPEQFI